MDHQFVFTLLDFQDKFQWSLDQIIHHIIQKLAQEIFEHSEDATNRIDSASIEGLEQDPNEFRKLLHSIVQKLGSKNMENRIARQIKYQKVGDRTCWKIYAIQ